MDVLEYLISFITAGLLAISKGEYSIQLSKSDHHRSLKEINFSHGGIKCNLGSPLFSSTFFSHSVVIFFNSSPSREKKFTFFKNSFAPRQKNFEEALSFTNCWQINVKKVRHDMVLSSERSHQLIRNPHNFSLNQQRSFFETHPPIPPEENLPLKEVSRIFKESIPFSAPSLVNNFGISSELGYFLKSRRLHKNKSEVKNFSSFQTEPIEKQTLQQLKKDNSFHSNSEKHFISALENRSEQLEGGSEKNEIPPVPTFIEKEKKSSSKRKIKIRANEHKNGILNAEVDSDSPLPSAPINMTNNFFQKNILAVDPEVTSINFLTQVEELSENNDIPPPPPPPLPFLIEGEQKPFCLRKKPQLEGSENEKTSKRKREANQQDDLMEALKKKLKARSMQQVSLQEGPSSQEAERETREDRWAIIEKQRLEASRPSNENAPKKPMWYKGKYITPDDPNYKLAYEIYVNTQKSHLKIKSKTCKKKELSTKAEQVRKLCASQAKKWDGKSMSEILKGLSALKLRKAKQNLDAAEDQNAQVAQSKESEDLQDKLIRELENKLKKRKPRGPIFIHRSPLKNKQKSPLKFHGVLKKRVPLTTGSQSQGGSENSLEKMPSVTLENTIPITPAVTIPSPIKRTSPPIKKAGFAPEKKSRPENKENQNPNTRPVNPKTKGEDTITKQKNKLKRPLTSLRQENTDFQEMCR